MLTGYRRLDMVFRNFITLCRQVKVIFTLLYKLGVPERRVLVVIQYKFAFSARPGFKSRSMKAHQCQQCFNGRFAGVFIVSQQKVKAHGFQAKVLP